MVFALDRHLVNGAIAEVDVLVAVAEREGHGVADVAGVGRARGIAAANRLDHGVVADDAGGVAVADRLKLLVPAADRQPHFHLDVRIGGGGDRDEHATECTRREERRGVGGDGARVGDRRVHLRASGRGDVRTYRWPSRASGHVARSAATVAPATTRGHTSTHGDGDTANVHRRCSANGVWSLRGERLYYSQNRPRGRREIA